MVSTSVLWLASRYLSSAMAASVACLVMPWWEAMAGHCLERLWTELVEVFELVDMVYMKNYWSG